MIYYGHYLDGIDQDKRERYKQHRYFDDCVEFCERWDQASFDPDYESFPIDFFRPMVEEVFAREPYQKSILEAPDQGLTVQDVARERIKI